jgi:hypothetical protein
MTLPVGVDVKVEVRGRRLGSEPPSTRDSLNNPLHL